MHCYRSRPGGVERGLLQELAFGARPSMEVSYVKNPIGDLYTESIHDLRDAYRRSFVELKGLHVETIEEFEELSPEAYRAVYSDGTVVAVNFGTEAVGGLKAMSAAVANR